MDRKKFSPYNPGFLKAVLCVCVMMLYIFCLYLLFCVKNEFHLPKGWSIQLTFLVTLSCFCSWIFLLAHRNMLKMFMYLIMMFILFIVSRTLESYIWISLFLMIIAILQIFSVFPLKYSIIMSFTAVLVPLVSWYGSNSGFTGPSREEGVVFLLLGVLFISLSSFIQAGNLQVKKAWDIIDNQYLSIRKLTKANAGFQEYANLAEERSIVAERMRITREIHDSVGYTLTNLLMMLEASTDLVGVSPLKLEKLLHQALDLIKDGHRDMRHSLRVLRNTQMKKQSTIEAVKNLARVFEDSTGVKVSVHLGNLPWSLEEEHDSLIYRFLQEGMTNALNHGDAKKIDVHFWISDDKININIIDDGKGSGKIEEGIGLKGMMERLALVQGTLTAKNIQGGFLLKAEIPRERPTDENLISR